MMKIKSLAVGALIIAAFCVSTPSHALVVSDTGAYAKWAQSLKKQKEEIDQILNVVKEQKEAVARMSGNLKRGLGIKEELAKMAGFSRDITDSFDNLASLDGFELDSSEHEDIKKKFDILFDPDQSYGQRIKSRADRDTARERSLKGVLENSEYIILEQEESLKKFADLSRQADETQSLKDATDLLNRLVTELLIIEQQQLMLMAQTNKASALTQYTGVDSDNAIQIPSSDNEPGWGNNNRVLEAVREGTKKIENDDTRESMCRIFGDCK